MEPGLSSRERFVFTGDLPATSGGQGGAYRACGGENKGDCPINLDNILSSDRVPRSEAEAEGGQHEMGCRGSFCANDRPIPQERLCLGGPSSCFVYSFVWSVE